MTLVLFLFGAFAVSVAVAAVLCRFGGRRAAPVSAEGERRTWQWLGVAGLCLPAALVALSWSIPDASLREGCYWTAGGLALSFLGLWAKTRDDGLYPHLRRKRGTPPANSAREEP